MITATRADLKRLFVDLAQLPASFIDRGEAIAISLEQARTVHSAAVRAQFGDRVAAASAALDAAGWNAIRAIAYGKTK